MHPSIVSGPILLTVLVCFSPGPLNEFLPWVTDWSTQRAGRPHGLPEREQILSAAG
jgi:hypothetical protein